MNTYSIISDGRVVRSAETFKAACEAAKEESLVDNGTTFHGVAGRIVSVWSGPVNNGRGTTKYITFICGRSA